MVFTTPEALPKVFGCSPRPGGNTDRAAQLFASGVSEVLERDVSATLLRRHTISPCLACYRCGHDPNGRCYLAEQDGSGALFQSLMDAPFVFFAAPIFFYHLPAQFKAWIDRSQSYYLRREAGDQSIAGLPRRKAYVCLVAGRSKGEHLFDGSLLTLKYFLSIFNFEMQEPLLLRGVDKAADLAGQVELCDSLRDLGRQAAKG